MYQNIIELKTKFEKISNKEWIKSDGKGSGSIGTTFEKELGLNNNSFEIPDFKGIEIKSKKIKSIKKNPYITLFNATFDGMYLFEMKRLYESYGWTDKLFTNSKILYANIYGKYLSKMGEKYKLKLKIDYKEEKVFLLIYDLNNKLIDQECYWTFDLLEEKLTRKLSYLAVIKADNKFINNIEYYNYQELNIYTLKNFNTFLKLLENGLIKININIGIYKNGKRKGKYYDHGTSFSIKEKYLTKLFNKI